MTGPVDGVRVAYDISRLVTEKRTLQDGVLRIPGTQIEVPLTGIFED